METGVRGVSLASARAPVAEECNFAHVTVTIQGTDIKLGILVDLQFLSEALNFRQEDLNLNSQ